jgi:hypothetical protein
VPSHRSLGPRYIAIAVNTEGRSRYSNTRISRSAVPVRVLDLDEVNGRANPTCIALGGFSAETSDFYGLARLGAVEKKPGTVQKLQAEQRVMAGPNSLCLPPLLASASPLRRVGTDTQTARNPSVFAGVRSLYSHLFVPPKDLR